MRYNIVAGKITLDLKRSQTAQLFGGITGNLSFKDIKQTHIFMGEVYISGNLNITDYLGSEDVLGSKYVYDQSKIYKNQTLLEINYGQTSENDLNLKSFYQSIGFDQTIWNFEDLDISEGVFPKLK